MRKNLEHRARIQNRKRSSFRKKLGSFGRHFVKMLFRQIANEFKVFGSESKKLRKKLEEYQKLKKAQKKKMLDKKIQKLVRGNTKLKEERLKKILRDKIRNLNDDLPFILQENSSNKGVYELKGMTRTLNKKLYDTEKFQTRSSQLSIKQNSARRLGR